MKKTAMAALIVGAVGIAAIVRWSSTSEAWSYEEAPVELSSVVHHTGDHLGLPARLESRGRHLIVIDRRGEKNVHVVDLASGELEASVGSVGEGPGEFLAPSTLTPDPEGDIWVFDGGTQRMTRLDPERLGDPSGWAPASLTLRDTPPVLSATWTADRHLLAGGLFPEGRFGWFDAAGRLLEQRGVLPAVEREAPPRAVQQLFMPTLVPRPGLEEFAAAAWWSNRVELVGLDGNPRRAFQTPFEFSPDYTVENDDGAPQVLVSRSSARGYVDLDGTERHLFALFSGRTDESHGPSQNYGRDVHVFAWSGELIDVLRLDRDAFGIEVDEDRGRLFAIQHDPVPAILRYELPSALGEPPAGSGTEDAPVQVTAAPAR